MIEGVFDASIFEEATFQTDEEVEAFVAVQDGIEQSFAVDHGPIHLLPHELEERRRLWVKYLKDWVKRHREERRRRDQETVMLFGLVTDGKFAL